MGFDLYLGAQYDQGDADNSSGQNISVLIYITLGLQGDITLNKILHFYLFCVVVSPHWYELVILLFIYSFLNQKNVKVCLILADQWNERIFFYSHFLLWLFSIIFTHLL